MFKHYYFFLLINFFFFLCYTNLDAAFDRRFLYKIEMAKPSVLAKAKIWKSKIEKLSEEEANLLSNQFNLSFIYSFKLLMVQVFNLKNNIMNY